MRKKRTIILIVALIFFFLYNLAMDPNVKLLENLPIGGGLLLTIQIFLMVIVGLILIEAVTDYFTDKYFKMFDEEDLSKVVKNNPVAVSIYMLAWSIRILAYAVLTGFTIYAYIGS